VHDNGVPRFPVLRGIQYPDAGDVPRLEHLVRLACVGRSVGVPALVPDVVAAEAAAAAAAHSAGAVNQLPVHGELYLRVHNVNVGFPVLLALQTAPVVIAPALALRLKTVRQLGAERDQIFPFGIVKARA
jgi:hypothetical protein